MSFRHSPLDGPVCPKKISIMVPVWGGRYISEFVQTGLRGLALAGNLGVCLESWDVEICFLTTAAGRRVFESDPEVALIALRCKITYVLIDDLVTNSNYGVTLTLAFARGISSKGVEQTKTAFIFLNADFVLAEDSLKVVLQNLKEGVRAVIAPSLRVSAEEVFPIVSDPSYNFSRRNMVKTALQNLHPTVIARTITQNEISCTEYGQFYWRVSEYCLIGCQHLIFHILIWPEQEIGEIRSYHDYSFVPDMVPSGRFKVLKDSDDFVMLELQGRRQESEMILFKSHDWDRIRGGLCAWTTKEHRSFALTPFIFHADDVSRFHLEQATIAKEFVLNLQNKLCHPPVDYVDHFYWQSGVVAWVSQKRSQIGGGALPAEIPSRYLEEHSLSKRIANLKTLGYSRSVYEEVLHLAGFGSDIFLQYVPENSVYWKQFDQVPDIESRSKWISEICAELKNNVQSRPINAADCIELAQVFPGTGWGEAGGTSSNSFRWLAPCDAATLALKREVNSSHLRVRLYLYTAPPDLLQDFEIFFDGRFVESGLDWEVDRFFIEFKIELIAKSDTRQSLLEIKLRHSATFPRASVAFSRVVFRQ